MSSRSTRGRSLVTPAELDTELAPTTPLPSTRAGSEDLDNSPSPRPSTSTIKQHPLTTSKGISLGSPTRITFTGKYITSTTTPGRTVVAASRRLGAVANGSSGSIPPLTPEGTSSGTPERQDEMEVDEKPNAQAKSFRSEFKKEDSPSGSVIDVDDLPSIASVEVIEEHEHEKFMSTRPRRSARPKKSLAEPTTDDEEEVDELRIVSSKMISGKGTGKRKVGNDDDSEVSVPLATKRSRTTTARQSSTSVRKPAPVISRLKVKSNVRVVVPSTGGWDDDNAHDESDEEDDVFVPSDEDDSDVIPDHGAFEHVSDFEGDDDGLDSDVNERSSRPRKRAPPKGKGRAKVKSQADEDVAEESDVASEDDVMMHAAMEASILDAMGESGSSSRNTGRQARNTEAAKRAAAAEARAALQIALKNGTATEQGIKSALKAHLSAEVIDNPALQNTIMTLSKMKGRKRDDKKVKNEKEELRAKVKELQRVEVKRIGRKLTQGEKNSVMLTVYHPELKNVWGDLESNIPIVKPVPMEAHPSLKLTLLPFQKESLYWMKKQEEGPWHGGMLADEMGMGKTIQTIALLLSEPRRKPSLVVAPVVALMQWKNEIQTHAEGFTVTLWHGSGRMKAEQLKKFDVVLVSYGTLEASFRRQQKGFKRGNTIVTEKSPMHSFQWHRVILDEAHNIKERSTNAAKAAFALDAKYKWCLSGTPLQNRVGELYSLIRFLGGDPFAYYYCKFCPCKSLHWAFSNKRNCDDCGHSPMQHLCFWNNEILTPIQNYAMAGPGQTAFKKLKILLDRMMLRRTKLERADDLGLPPRTITVRRDYFSPEEKELYLSLFTATQRQFSTYVSDGTLLNNYSNIFSLITRMRQMACHPDLVLRSKTSKYIPSAGPEEIVCRICNDVADDAIVSKCNHIFDRECIRQYLEMQSNPNPDCPVCHVGISIDLEAEALEVDEDKKKKKQGILGRLDIDNWRSSTKLEALVEELTELRNKDSTVKSLVFSQFVSFLDLIAFRLQRAGFVICRLEGGMSPQARDATIQHFMKNSHVSIMLISLKAGGVALNLTEASRVYLMDSWWNPSVERQAMDRIHRLGQHRSVEVIKLVVEDSIENRIVQLQDKKLAMTEAALSSDSESALGKLTPEDLSFLFKL